MSGFIIKCNDCGSEIQPREYHQLQGDKITIHINKLRKGTEYSKTDIILWCEQCDNSVVFTEND